MRASSSNEPYSCLDLASDLERLKDQEFSHEAPLNPTFLEPEPEISGPIYPLCRSRTERTLESSTRSKYPTSHYPQDPQRRYLVLSFKWNKLIFILFNLIRPHFAKLDEENITNRGISLVSCVVEVLDFTYMVIRMVIR